MTCSETIAIGAYVLGAQDVGERIALERHLAECASCREALLRFAGLPGLLNVLTLEDVTVSPFDPDLGNGVPPRAELGWPSPTRESISTAAVDLPDRAGIPAPIGTSFRRPDATQRRLPARRALIAAAMVVAAAGVLIGRGLVNDPAPQEPTTVTWAATDGVGGIDTTATLSNQTWGTDIQLRMKDLKPGELCKLVVHARSGQSETTGWWTTNYIHEADVPASTSIALPDIDRVDVVTATGTVLTSLTESTR